MILHRSGTFVSINEMTAVGIYLDAQASTPLAPEALEALVATLAQPANPNSPHAAGRRAEVAVVSARQAVADLIGAAPGEIIFTSGATEANNLALFGFARAASRTSDRRTIVTSDIEHPSVAEAAEALVAEGFVHRRAPVSPDGRLDLSALSNILDCGDVLLVSVMAANNVTGLIQPVREAATLAHANGALIHCDAAQLGGRAAIDVVELDVDSLSLSGHKMYGPTGVGALYVSASAMRPRPISFGGGQEGGLRAGTTPAALVASFGAAAEVAGTRLGTDAAHLRGLTDHLVEALKARQVRFTRLGSDHFRVPGSLCLAFHDCHAQDIVERLSNKVFLSTGSACSSGRDVVSPVLIAMKLETQMARSTLRLCFNRYSTHEEAELAATLISDAIAEATVETGSFVQ